MLRTPSSRTPQQRSGESRLSSWYEGNAHFTAHLEHEAAVERAKEAVGYFELERQQEEAVAEERRLCREVAVMQARTVPGLLAKLSAVADIYAYDDLEKDTEYMSGRNVSMEEAAIFVLRDCARMMGEPQ